MSYQRLLQEYDEIERLACALSHLIGRPTVDIGEVSASMSLLGIAVDEHLTFEHRSIYEAAGTRSRASLQLESMDRTGLQAMQAGWHQHQADRIGEVIGSDWSTFQQETTVMLASLTEYMRREAEQVYPLALQLGLVRLRDAAPRYVGSRVRKPKVQPSA